MSRVGTSSLLSVDVPKRIAEASDRSTECSDSACDAVECYEISEADCGCSLDFGVDVEIHADIDEEDDDLFFSTHKRLSTIAGSSSEQPNADEEDVCYIVNAEIDEEDDDVFFSAHRGPSLSMSSAVEHSSLKVQESLDVIRVHAEIDESDDDVFFSEHRQTSNGDNGSVLCAMSHDENSCNNIDDNECRKVRTSLGHVETLDKIELSSSSQLEHTASLRSFSRRDTIASGRDETESSPNSQIGRSISLRSLTGRDSFASVGSENACSKLKLLGDLKGRRTGGVRRHLERKLTQESDV
jgi:hypothetical protein